MPTFITQVFSSAESKNMLLHKQ